MEEAEEALVAAQEKAKDVQEKAEAAQEHVAVWIERVESNTLIVTTEKPNS